MIKTVFFFLLALRMSAAPIERTFTEGAVNFPNPERGFYTRDPAPGRRLIMVELDLRAFKDRPLTAEKLAELHGRMTEARRAGVKLIFRAAYGFTGRDYRADPKDLGRILGHIRQISAVLAENADVLLTVQAGFLGPWGEWHGSNWGDPPSLEARRAVLVGWLAALPAPVTVQVRRPMFIRDIFPNEIDAARVGWHDDSFMALPDDLGTYVAHGWSRERELQWCNQHDRSVPFGGETIELSGQTPIAEVMREMELLHLTFLNAEYQRQTLQRWRASEYHGENAGLLLEQRIGYRLVAENLRCAARRGKLYFDLTLTNAGFASPLQPRVVTAALLRDHEVRTVELTDDPRQWGPWAGTIMLHGAIPLPPGRWRLALRLGDPAPGLREDGRYDIRFENSDIPFLDTGGWNILADL
ncbi:MAG TPA: DUF4832 domain-containing protein [Verrucomicrobiae bacterium]|jgi:hypothetical protein|nr:DUF4832 domain-containing protein [Verrucomicrobiae bacterium]